MKIFKSLSSSAEIIMSNQLEMLSENSTQWISISTVLPEIQKKEIKPFVLLALKELEGNPDSRTSNLMNADKFAALRSIVRYVTRLRSAIKEPWNQEDLRIFLESLRFSPECVAELTSLFCSENIYSKIPEHLRIKPGLASLQWKIDLSQYQANMNALNANKGHSKEMMRQETNIILVLELTDKSVHTYRLSINKFHELRYTIATALKNMIVLEKRKCMRKD